MVRIGVTSRSAIALIGARCCARCMRTRAFGEPHARALRDASHDVIPWLDKRLGHARDLHPNRRRKLLAVCPKEPWGTKIRYVIKAKKSRKFVAGVLSVCIFSRHIWVPYTVRDRCRVFIFNVRDDVAHDKAGKACTHKVGISLRLYRALPHPVMLQMPDDAAFGRL